MQLTDILQTLALIAPVISCLTAIIAAIFISKQVANIRRNREVDTLLKIIALSDNELTREAKQWMMYELNDTITIQQLKLNKEVMAKFSQLVHLFETMGVLVNLNYVPKDLIFDKYGLLIAGSWNRLQPLIKNLRIDLQTEEFAENFELMVSEYDSWASRVGLKVARGSRVRIRDARKFLDRRNENSE